MMIMGCGGGYFQTACLNSKKDLFRGTSQDTVTRAVLRILSAPENPLAYYCGDRLAMSGGAVHGEAVYLLIGRGSRLNELQRQRTSRFMT